MTRPRVVLKKRGKEGLELRVDGTIASRFHPTRPPTGSVWDAIAAPLLLLPPARRRRILVLGLGAGSVAHLARRVAPDAHIVGVEIDADVLRAARAHFGLDALGIETVLDDARAFLARERGRYDAVVDDVFIGDARSVRKPDWMIEEGLPRAGALVAPGGLLISNTIHETGRVARALRPRRGGLVAIGVARYWNRILASGEPVKDAAQVRRAVGAEPLFAEAVARFEFRTL